MPHLPSGWTLAGVGTVAVDAQVIDALVDVDLVDIALVSGQAITSPHHQFRQIQWLYKCKGNRRYDLDRDSTGNRRCRRIRRHAISRESGEADTL